MNITVDLPEKLTGPVLLHIELGQIVAVQPICDSEMVAYLDAVIEEAITAATDTPTGRGHS